MGCDVLYQKFLEGQGFNYALASILGVECCVLERNQMIQPPTTMIIWTYKIKIEEWVLEPKSSSICVSRWTFRKAQVSYMWVERNLLNLRPWFSIIASQAFVSAAIWKTRHPKGHPWIASVSRSGEGPEHQSSKFLPEIICCFLCARWWWLHFRRKSFYFIATCQISTDEINKRKSPWVVAMCSQGWHWLDDALNPTTMGPPKSCFGCRSDRGCPVPEELAALRERQTHEQTVVCAMGVLEVVRARHREICVCSSPWRHREEPWENKVIPGLLKGH